MFFLLEHEFFGMLFSKARNASAEQELIAGWAGNVE